MQKLGQRQDYISAHKLQHTITYVCCRQWWWWQSTINRYIWRNIYTKHIKTRYNVRLCFERVASVERERLGEIPDQQSDRLLLLLLQLHLQLQLSNTVTIALFLFQCSLSSLCLVRQTQSPAYTYTLSSVFFGDLTHSMQSNGPIVLFIIVADNTNNNSDHDTTQRQRQRRRRRRRRRQQQ